MLKFAIHMNVKALIIVVLICFASPFYSQDSSKKDKKKKKEKKEKKLPTNVEAFPKNYLFRPRFVYPEVWLNASSRLLGKGETFNYKPGIAGIVGLSFKIKKVSASGAFQIPPSESFKQKYGATKFRNININIQGRTILWGFFYRDYKGFYLNDIDKVYPSWNKEALGYPKMPKLRVIEGGLNIGISFNRNFSLNAAFAQSERQKKSAGSFLMGVSGRYQLIETDSVFIPPSQATAHPNLYKFKHGNFASTILTFGFGYQFVYKYFHFTPVCLAGSGIQFQSYTQVDRKRVWFNYPTYANVKAQLGYNGNHFFTNLIYQYEFNSIPIKESRIRLINNWWEIGVGVRF